MSQLLALIGLGVRGGNAILGVAGARAALQAGRCACLVVAADRGPRTAEKVVRLAEARGVPCVIGPPAGTIGRQVGRDTVQAVAITDVALARGVLKETRATGSVTEGTRG